jgi:hypothetical protein
VRDLYPPVGTLLATVVARILPLGALGLSLLGALAAGFFLQKIAEAMVQRGLALPTRVLFLLAIAFNPFGVQLITRDSLLFLSIGFFALGVGETVRFLYWASTRDGFRAGILLMMAALTDPLGVALVAIAGIAAMFYLPDDLERPGRRRASVLVATFPTIGAFATFAFLQWAFGGLTAADVAAVLPSSSAWWRSSCTTSRSCWGGRGPDGRRHLAHAAHARGDVRAARAGRAGPRDDDRRRRGRDPARVGRIALESRDLGLARGAPRTRPLSRGRLANRHTGHRGTSGLHQTRDAPKVNVS